MPKIKKDRLNPAIFKPKDATVKVSSPISGYKDKWNLILSDKRFRSKSPTIDSDGRNPFENDYGRLISSAPVRRLQDKTQVFPLERSDYIRTRLTHSLEVSYLASSIGQSIEKLLFDNKEIIAVR